MAKGGSRGAGLGVCILLPAIFKNVFDVYNFSIILNHLDNDNLYALSAQSKMCEENASYW